MAAIGFYGISIDIVRTRRGLSSRFRPEWLPPVPANQQRRPTGEVQSNLTEIEWIFDASELSSDFLFVILTPYLCTAVERVTVRAA